MNALGHLRIDEIKLQPGQEWTEATAAWRFIRIHSGAAYWLGLGKPRALVESEMIVIAPGAKSVVRASQLGEVVLHGFLFDPDLLCGLLTLQERHFFEHGDAGEVGQVQFLPSTHPATRRFAALVAGGTKLEGLAGRAEVLGMVAAIFDKNATRPDAPISLSTSVLHRFDQLIAQMPDMELINHTPEQLARLCGCTARHFNRLFRRHFGTSARERQTELRLAKARRLLATTDREIAAVALDSGYRSVSLFNQLFKQRFGMTPTEWRQQAINGEGVVLPS